MLKSELSKNSLSEPLYDSESNKSITSLSIIYPGPTVVYYDAEIGHLQTQEIENIDNYYDEQYQFFDQSDEEDVLYDVVDGKEVFRQQHQVDTLIKKDLLTKGAKILDYGCAKGTVLKRLASQRKDIEPYLFDVSKMYTHLWDRFLTPDHYASYQPKIEWNNSFDIVTSFFAFEHTPDPLKELATIKTLLKEDGLVYLIVPNVYENPADFIVVDHVHHYSSISIEYMFSKAGFETIEIDTTSHFAAFIAIGRKKSSNELVFTPDAEKLAEISAKSNNLASYWNSIKGNIRKFEKSLNGEKFAIYGGGVYGTYISTCLENDKNLECFIDQNHLLQNKSIVEKPVLYPQDLPADVKNVIVGLNPKIAKTAIASIESWIDKDLNLFFI